MNHLDWTSWKGTAAALLTLILSGLEALFGNPWSADGRGLALVCIFLGLDFVLGTACAMATGTWCCRKLKQGACKLAIWGVLLCVSRQLQAPIGVSWAERVLDFTGDYVLVYLIWVDLLSILRHCVALALVTGTNVPGLPHLVDRVERWHQESLAKLPCACRAPASENGKTKGEPTP